MSKRMSQQELESYLWGAAVILRGLVDAGDYKQFVFPLIFFKRLSDVWDEDHASALAESKGDVSYATATANDRFVIPEGAHWKDVRGAAKDVGKKLQAALRAIEAAASTASLAMRRGPTKSACPTSRSRTSSSTSRGTRSHSPTCPRTSSAMATSS